LQAVRRDNVVLPRRNAHRDDGSKDGFYRAARGGPRETLQSQLDRAMASPSSPPARRLFAGCLAALALALAAAPRAWADPGAPVLLVVGDSISAAYGLPPGTGWVDLLAARLAAQGYPHRTVNASISGDTTAGGRARLPALLAAQKPSIVVVELGGNDGLRGGNLASTRENLAAMLSAIKDAGAKALLVGMRLPPNYGASYVREFEALYAGIAKARRVPLVPFFFEGFGERNDLFQPDRIHPTAAAQPLLLDNVWPALLPLLGSRR
jgi:acyl-CoA thioesterase-1